MVERGTNSEVSGEGEVKLKCFSMVEKGSPVGCPAFPIGQGKDSGYTREKEGKKKEKNREGESSGAALPFSSAGRSCESYR
jgi:hypothetical protein